MKKELKPEAAAYTEQKEEEVQTPREIKPEERQFWLDIKYSDENFVSDR